MKQLFTIMGAAVIMVSCKQTPVDDTKVLSANTNAQEYADFVKWKAAKESNAKENKVIYRTKYVPVATSNNNTATSNIPATVTKKGWSKAAKGAAIGAGTGAVAGAIINKKNRAVGAAVGGVLGAGVGYGIGRSKDKKDGRY